MKITGDTELDGKLIDTNNEAGTSGQVLSSTETETDWIDVADRTIFSFDNGLVPYSGGGAVLGHDGFTTGVSDMVPYPGTLKNLYVRTGDPGNGVTVTFTVQTGTFGTNGVVNSGLTCSIVGDGAPSIETCTELSSTAAMNAGDHFRIIISDTGGVAPLIQINAVLEYFVP